MAWTADQQKAIDLEGTNIIVSAGAGSGKTAVLTERVIRKLKSGIDINRLLILTFTKEAAKEMQDRIRKKIKKEGLTKQLDLLDSAYITTFDSYAFSIVKKYHYMLNISKNISIIDSSIIDMYKRDKLEEIFNNLYTSHNALFEKLISNFCFKDDMEIKDTIIKISNSLDLNINKDSCIESYLDTYYHQDYIDSLIIQYIEVLKNKIKDIQSSLHNLSIYATGTYMEKIEEVLLPLFNSDNYSDIKNNSLVSLPRLSKASDEEKKYKEEINNIIKEINELTLYENIDEMKEEILETKDYVSIILDIIKKLDKYVSDFKKRHDNYEFIDIAKMAISVVKNNHEILNELKYFYNEICVDEYQDTNDLQEAFVSLIANNNVYMVGDVKQSIYRFRNANPDIFKNKYVNYQDHNGGEKIDLIKNFRSREEVLHDINEIFNRIMDLRIGGAQYQESHQMVFGNTNYQDNKQNNYLEIYNYEKSKLYSKEEIEIFTVARDIKEKIDNHYQVLDKETNILRDIKYSDICIIMDRNSAFDKYKKIFEYLNLPLVLYKDEVLTNETDIILIKNIINLIVKIKNKEFDKHFKYYFTSIARSYLYGVNDQEILNYFMNKNFQDSDIFKKGQEISDKLDTLTSYDMLNMIIDIFNIYDKNILVGGIVTATIRLDYLKNIATNLTNLGYSPYKSLEYLNNMIDNNIEIKYSLNTSVGDNIKIMNIHKSKGLEFPLCYFTGFHKAFNLHDMKEKFIYDLKYGIITPVNKDGIKSTIIKVLARENYIHEEISEKIRLFYVAVTRAREKMIIVTNLNNDEIELDDSVRLKYRSFLDIMNSIKKYLSDKIKDINIDELNITDDYNKIKSLNYLDYINKTSDTIENKEISIDNEIFEEKRFSKNNKELVTKDNLDNMKLGTKIHYLLEITDFIHPNYDIIEDVYKGYIKAFLGNDLLKDINKANIYKEYEFVYHKDNEVLHGFIDLMLEYDNHIDIIDYKLKHTSDDAYLKQLKGYQEYIYNLTNKKTNIYLYSIMDKKIIDLNESV
ncbi:MAG: UvrD-helicase domain-containing protein [Bacilli bacterium]|nr:UvrD-helicase domain-containing protein [Bacilli bacterium]